MVDGARVLHKGVVTRPCREPGGLDEVDAPQQLRASDESIGREGAAIHMEGQARIWDPKGPTRC